MAESYETIDELTPVDKDFYMKCLNHRQFIEDLIEAEVLGVKGTKIVLDIDPSGTIQKIENTKYIYPHRIKRYD